MSVPIEPNSYILSSLVSSLQDATVAAATGSDISTADPKTELDSHANMVVLGKNAYVFERTGRTCNVKPFTTTLGTARDVPIVDGAVAYDCPYSHR